MHPVCFVFENHPVFLKISKSLVNKTLNGCFACGIREHYGTEKSNRNQNTDNFLKTVKKQAGEKQPHLFISFSYAVNKPFFSYNLNEPPSLVRWFHTFLIAVKVNLWAVTTDGVSGDNAWKFFRTCDCVELKFELLAPQGVPKLALYSFDQNTGY